MRPSSMWQLESWSAPAERREGGPAGEGEECEASTCKGAAASIVIEAMRLIGKADTLRHPTPGLEWKQGY